MCLVATGFAKIRDAIEWPGVGAKFMSDLSGQMDANDVRVYRE